MRKFLLKTIAYIAVISAITLGINALYGHLNISDPKGVRKFKVMPDNIAICNFGSSHALSGFNYEDVTEKECFNFALTAQYISYDKRLFDQYSEHLAEGAVVFIPVSYFSLFGNGEQNEPQFVNKNSRYYEILPIHSVKEYDYVSAVFEKWLPSTTDPVNLVKTLFGGMGTSDAGRQAQEENDAGVDIQKSANHVSTDYQKSAEEVYTRHLVTNKLDEKGNRVINQEEVEALKSLVLACKEKGFTPILVTTPFLHDYTDVIRDNDPSFFREFYSLVHSVSEECGVAYYDYAFDDRFSHNYEWFSDSDHLNPEGARRFTNILLEETAHLDVRDSNS